METIVPFSIMCWVSRMRLRKVSRPFTPLFRGWGGAPALSEGKLAAIGLPAWDKAASQMFDIQSQEVMWGGRKRSEEHTSELQSLMRISYAVFCLKKKKKRIKGITQ